MGCCYFKDELTHLLHLYTRSMLNATKIFSKTSMVLRYDLLFLSFLDQFKGKISTSNIVKSKDTTHCKLNIITSI